MQVKFAFTPPIDGLEFAVSRCANDLSDMTVLFEAFEDLFKAGMAEQFATQGAWGAGGWVALSDEYAAWKAKHHPGPIGYLHGHLRSAMAGGAGYTSKITKQSAEFGLGSGPAEKYGEYFAGGTEKMPARPIIAFPRSFATAHQKATQRFVMNIAQQAFAGF